MRKHLVFVMLSMLAFVAGMGTASATSPPVLLEDDPVETIERYALILFPYDSATPGPINERILREYVYEGIRSTSKVTVVGHADSLGDDMRNRILSVARAENVAGQIRRDVPRFAQLEAIGVGESRVYRGDFPEVRFYNRTVLIEIRTPGR
jgi:outer membrane protein OmpA-like peptidoglycan-associated protein